jgi:hypothetical protein
MAQSYGHLDILVLLNVQGEVSDAEHFQNESQIFSIF